MTDSRHPVAVLCSGSGTNLQAIIDAAEDPAYGARIAVVVSDRPEVRALERARRAGIPAEIVPWQGREHRRAFTKAVVAAVEAHAVETIVLAGFLRILSEEAIERFPNRILNIHPSLLPAFPGTVHAVADAVAHGVKLTGVTVHYVDREVDTGPIIYQEAVPVLVDDTPETLHARIQRVEHRVYPDVIEMHTTGRLRVEGRTVVWIEPETGP
jgi:phosphoribosylglycinamide formyltransferase-1